MPPACMDFAKTTLCSHRDPGYARFHVEGEHKLRMEFVDARSGKVSTHSLGCGIARQCAEGEGIISDLAVISHYRTSIKLP